MTTLTGTIENGSVAVPGKLRLTLVNGTVKSTAPKKVFVKKSFEIICTSGAVPGSTTIEETETKNTSYFFEYFPRISTGPDVYDTVNLDPFPFYAVIPNIASVDLADLVPTGMVSDVLATGALRIAKIIAGDPNLASSIGGVNPRGAYNNLTTYKRGDMVSYLQRFFIASEVLPFTGKLPTNTSYWMEIPVQPTGSIALGDTTVYGSGWSASGLAPTQQALYNVIETIQTNISLKANSNSPTIIDALLSGNPQCSTPLTTDNDLSVANTAFVKSVLFDYALLNSPVFTGDPKAPTPTTTDNDTSIATTAFVNNLLLNKITFTGSNPFIIVLPNNIRIICGSSIIAINAGGAGTINLPITLSSIFTATICNGDVSVTNNPFGVVSISTSSINFSTFPFVSGNVRVDWIAIGVI